MKKVSWVLLISGAFFLMLASCGYMMGQMANPSQQLRNSPYLGLVKIEGTLMDPLPILDQIRQHVSDKNCRGLMIRVDSPGGAVGAAQEIYQRVLSLRTQDFPVVASYGNISASGGVYATAAASYIYANSGTLTGSIGVITQFPEASGLLEKVGVKVNVIKSGDHKATGNPFAQMDEASRAKMQGVIDDTWMQFVEAVAVGRNLSPDSVKTFADGSVFTGRKAKELGLIDDLGGMESAREWLTEATGMPSGSDLIEIIPPQPLIDRLLQQPVSQALEGFGLKVQNLPMFLFQ